MLVKFINKVKFLLFKTTNLFAIKYTYVTKIGNNTLYMVKSLIYNFGFDKINMYYYL